MKQLEEDLYLNNLYLKIERLLNVEESGDSLEVLHLQWGFDLFQKGFADAKIIILF